MNVALGTQQRGIRVPQSFGVQLVQARFHQLIVPLVEDVGMGAHIFKQTVRSLKPALIIRAERS